MKMSAAGLKSLDYKKMLIDHGEKLALGVVVLIGLLILVGSRWATYKKDPRELISSVDENRKLYMKSTWPEEEKLKFETNNDILADAKALLSPLDEQRFRFGDVALHWPVIPPQKPAEEPQWYPVERLTADAGSGIFAIAPPVTEMMVDVDGTGGEGLPVAGGATPTGQPLPGVPGLEDYLPNPNAPKPGFGEEGETLPFGPGGMSASESGAMAGGEYGSEFGSEGSGEYGDSMAVQLKGEPRRYVAVRGVYPLQKELQEVARALNLETASEASDLLVFTDFELERQKAMAGSDPWAGEWEKVDVEVALDMLNKVQGFDIDEVDPTVTDAVFTMPLPARMPGVGTWGSRATHPALSEYELTDEAKRKQAWLQQQMAQYAQQQEELKKTTIQPKGFAGQVYNVRSAYSDASEDSGFMNQLGTAARGLGGGAMALTPEDIKRMVTAGGSFLLFRYIDFDVEPGNAYRYRVRLQVANPNAGRPLDEVARSDVSDGLYRWTAFSEASSPVIVPQDTLYFLTGTKTGSSRLPDTAEFDVFQWSSEFGTYSHGIVSVEPGQFVAGVRNLEVLDLAGAGGTGQTFKQQDFSFTTHDSVVDVGEIGRLPSIPREWNLPRRLDIPQQVLLVNEFGELIVQDPISRESDHARWKQRQEIVAQAYDYLRKPVVEEGLEGEGSGSEGEYGEGEGGESLQNPLRRRGRRRVNPAMMGGEGSP